MKDPRQPLQPGDQAPAFALPAASREGTVSLDDLRGRPFLIGFFRGLHCPFCRRQVMQFAEMQPALHSIGVETVVVVNTPVERARMYHRYRPMPVTLLADPDCLTHRAFGVPQVEFLAEGSSEPPEWPSRTTMAQFEAARINPQGLLPQPMHPMEANSALNAKDGFELVDADKAISEKHGTQLVGHFLVDAASTIAWVAIEAPDGPNSLALFPDPEQILEQANRLSR